MSLELLWHSVLGLSIGIVSLEVLFWPYRRADFICIRGSLLL